MAFNAASGRFGSFLLPLLTFIAAATAAPDALARRCARTEGERNPSRCMLERYPLRMSKIGLALLGERSRKRRRRRLEGKSMWEW